MWLSNFFSCHHSFVTIHRRNRLCDHKATDICSLFYTYSFFFFFLNFLFWIILAKNSCLFIRNFQEIHFSGLFFTQMCMDRAIHQSNVYGPLIKISHWIGGRIVIPERDHSSSWRNSCDNRYLGREIGEFYGYIFMMVERKFFIGLFVLYPLVVLQYVYGMRLSPIIIW